MMPIYIHLDAHMRWLNRVEFVCLEMRCAAAAKLNQRK